MMALLNFDRIIGLVLGFLLAWAVLAGINQFIWLPNARDEGRALERAELDAATNRAIGELTDAADRARFNRRLCVERGGVYVNATGQCEQAKAQPDS
jgi:hypothetical protein